MPMEIQPQSQGRTKRKQGLIVQAPICLRLCLLRAGVISWSIDPVLESVAGESFRLKLYLRNLSEPHP